MSSHTTEDGMRKVLQEQLADPMQQIKDQITRAMPSLSHLATPLLDISSLEMPEIPSIEERHSYESSKDLIRSVIATIRQWKKSQPDACQPSILALLHGGVQIEVTSLTNVSFHGLRVEGVLGGRPCVVLTHQATVQLLCYPAEPATDQPRRKIGFCVDGHLTEE
jgi:hypothetical protein